MRHKGERLENGHYMAYIRDTFYNDAQNQWEENFSVHVKVIITTLNLVGSATVIHGCVRCSQSMDFRSISLLNSEQINGNVGLLTVATLALAYQTVNKFCIYQNQHFDR